MSTSAWLKLYFLKTVHKTVAHFLWKIYTSVCALFSESTASIELKLPQVFPYNKSVSSSVSFANVMQHTFSMSPAGFVFSIFLPKNQDNMLCTACAKLMDFEGWGEHILPNLHFAHFYQNLFKELENVKMWKKMLSQLLHHCNLFKPFENITMWNVMLHQVL